MLSMKQAATYLESKKHYPILDGLRGVASVMVIVFHVLEAFTGGNRFVQIINHGYLAVDFFFLLSGFVVAYAYDDRWGKMTPRDFYKRRLVRLQPMVVLGSVIGAALFYFQGGNTFPLIADIPVWKMLLVMIIADIAGAKPGSTAKFESCRLLRIVSGTRNFGSRA